MYDVAIILHEQAGLDRDAAVAHWRTTHADIARRLPGLRAYSQGPSYLGEGAAPNLGVAVLSFDSKEAFELATATPEFGAAAADLAKFADPARMAMFELEPVKGVGSA